MINQNKFRWKQIVQTDDAASNLANKYLSNDVKYLKYTSVVELKPSHAICSIFIVVIRFVASSYVFMNVILLVFA